MRAIIILAAVVLIGVFAWMTLGGQEQTAEPAAQVDAPETEGTMEEVVVDTEEAVDEAADEATGAVEEMKEEAATAVEALEEKVDETVEAVQDQANDAVEAAGEKVNDAVEGAMESVNDAVGGAADAVTGTAPDASALEGQVNDAIQGAVDSANDTMGAATDAAPDASGENEIPMETSTDLTDALSVDGFDAATLLQAIDNSDLSFTESTLAKGLIDKAKDNPELIQGVVDQLKDMLAPQ